MGSIGFALSAALGAWAVTQEEGIPLHGRKAERTVARVADRSPGPGLRRLCRILRNPGNPGHAPGRAGLGLAPALAHPGPFLAEVGADPGLVWGLPFSICHPAFCKGALRMARPGGKVWSAAEATSPAISMAVLLPRSLAYQRRSSRYRSAASSMPRPTSSNQAWSSRGRGPHHPPATPLTGGKSGKQPRTPGWPGPP